VHCFTFALLTIAILVHIGNMKYLIVGLGNPGEKYENTRHNIGFKVLDELAREQKESFVLDKAAFRAEITYRGRKLVLIKPVTYMNLSGKAVQYWLQAEKINLENMVVITDDIALPFGKLRMKGKGSDGGHNGLKDIQTMLKTQEYVRLRFGVGSNFSKGRQSDYVLGEWTKEESAALPERIMVATEFVKSFSFQGLGLTMTHWNGK
jgi:PTH1 family peptidyl-tRNA hydrolase